MESRVAGRLVVHDHQGIADRGDLRGVRRLGLLAVEAREPAAAAREQHHRRAEPQLGARRSQGPQPPLRPRRPRSTARRARPGRLRPHDLDAAAPLAHDARRVPGARLPHHLALPAVRCRARTASGPDDVVAYLAVAQQASNGISWSGGWTPATTDRVASGLLRIAADFGLLTGGIDQGVRVVPPAGRELPLPASRDGPAHEPNARRIIESPDWRMYLMDAAATSSASSCAFTSSTGFATKSRAASPRLDLPARISCRLRRELVA